MGIIDFYWRFNAGRADLCHPSPPSGLRWSLMFPTGRFRGARYWGALGHGSRMLMMSAGFNIEWSTFMASLLVGGIGIQWSRWYLAHLKCLPSRP